MSGENCPEAAAVDAEERNEIACLHQRIRELIEGQDLERLCRENDDLRQRVRELREALRFYADEDNWRWDFEDAFPSPPAADKGRRAQRALAEGEGE